MSRPSPSSAETAPPEAGPDQPPARWADFSRLTLGGEIPPAEQCRIYARLSERSEGKGGLMLAKSRASGGPCQAETVHRLNYHRSQRQLYGHLIQALAVCHGRPGLARFDQPDQPAAAMTGPLRAAVAGQSSDSWPADDPAYHRRQAERQTDDLVEAARASWSPPARPEAAGEPLQAAWRGSLRALAVFGYGQAWDHRLQAERLAADLRRQLFPGSDRQRKTVWTWDRILAGCSGREQFLADQIYRLEIPAHLKAKYWQRLAGDTLAGRVMTSRIPRQPGNLGHYEQQLLLADFYANLSQSWSGLWIDQANAVSTASLTNDLHRPGFDDFLHSYRPETMPVDSPEQFLDHQADSLYHRDRCHYYRSERGRIEALIMLFNRLGTDRRPDLSGYSRLVRRQQVGNQADADQLDRLLAQTHQQQLLALAKLHFGLELSHQAQQLQLDWARPGSL